MPTFQPWPDAGQPDDIAGVALWLAGPDSGFVTGEAIRVDGGAARRPGPRLVGMTDPHGAFQRYAGFADGTTGRPPEKRARLATPDRQRPRPTPATIGASSAGAAPWRITPSAPRSNCRWTVATHCSGDPVAAVASHAVRDQRGDVLQLRGRRRLVDRAPVAGDERVGTEADQRRRDPSRSS